MKEKSGLISSVAVTTEQVVTEDGARKLPPHLLAGKIRRPALFFTSLALLLGLGYVAYRFGPDALAAKKAGFFEKYDKEEYAPSRAENLKAQFTALMLYHESEERFPNSEHWMDAIEPLLKTNNLKEGEAEKKLVHPEYAGVFGQYGYAMNDTISEKYKGDIKDREKTYAIYESRDASRNAHGQPKDLKRLGKAQGITLGGMIEIVK